MNNPLQKLIQTVLVSTEHPGAGQNWSEGESCASNAYNGLDDDDLKAPLKFKWWKKKRHFYSSRNEIIS